jgi:hypothetical protein
VSLAGFKGTVRELAIIRRRHTKPHSSLQPILNLQGRHPSELGDIVRDADRVDGSRMGGDMLAKRRASCRGLRALCYGSRGERTHSAEVPGTRAASCIGSVGRRARRLYWNGPIGDQTLQLNSMFVNVRR